MKQTFIKTFRMGNGHPITREQIAEALRMMADDIEHIRCPDPDPTMHYLGWNRSFIVEGGGHRAEDSGRIRLTLDL